MLRLVGTDEGITVDARQTMPGRGAYVHRDVVCLEAAVKRGGLAKSLRRQVPPGALAEIVAGVADAIRSQGN